MEEKLTDLLNGALDQDPELTRVKKYLDTVIISNKKTHFHVTWRTIEAFKAIIEGSSSQDVWDLEVIDILLDCFDYIISKSDTNSWNDFGSELANLLPDFWSAIEQTEMFEYFLCKLLTAINRFPEGSTARVWNTVSLRLFKMFSSRKFSFPYKHTALKLFIDILKTINHSERYRFAQENLDLFRKFFGLVKETGDFECQVDIIEIIFLHIFNDKELASDLLKDEDEAIVRSFTEFDFAGFESNCRRFLNNFNDGLKSKKKVFSINCNQILFGGFTLEPPLEESSGIWMDANKDSGRLGITCTNFQSGISEPEACTLIYLDLKDAEDIKIEFGTSLNEDCYCITICFKDLISQYSRASTNDIKCTALESINTRENLRQFLDYLLEFTDSSQDLQKLLRKKSYITGNCSVVCKSMTIDRTSLFKPSYTSPIKIKQPEKPEEQEMAPNLIRDQTTVNNAKPQNISSTSLALVPDDERLPHEVQDNAISSSINEGYKSSSINDHVVPSVGTLRSVEEEQVAPPFRRADKKEEEKVKEVVSSRRSSRLKKQSRFQPRKEKETAKVNEETVVQEVQNQIKVTNKKKKGLPEVASGKNKRTLPTEMELNQLPEIVKSSLRLAEAFEEIKDLKEEGAAKTESNEKNENAKQKPQELKKAGKINEASYRKKLPAETSAKVRPSKTESKIVKKCSLGKIWKNKFLQIEELSNKDKERDLEKPTNSSLLSSEGYAFKKWKTPSTSKRSRFWLEKLHNLKEEKSSKVNDEFDFSNSNSDSDSEKPLKKKDRLPSKKLSSNNWKPSKSQSTALCSGQKKVGPLKSENVVHRELTLDSIVDPNLKVLRIEAKDNGQYRITQTNDMSVIAEAEKALNESQEDNFSFDFVNDRFKKGKKLSVANSMRGSDVEVINLTHSSHDDPAGEDINNSSDHESWLSTTTNPGSRFPNGESQIKDTVKKLKTNQKRFFQSNKNINDKEEDCDMFFQRKPKDKGNLERVKAINKPRNIRQERPAFDEKLKKSDVRAKKGEKPTKKVSYSVKTRPKSDKTRGKNVGFLKTLKDMLAKVRSSQQSSSPDSNWFVTKRKDSGKIRKRKAPLKTSGNQIQTGYKIETKVENLERFRLKSKKDLEVKRTESEKQTKKAVDTVEKFGETLLTAQEKVISDSVWEIETLKDSCGNVARNSKENRGVKNENEVDYRKGSINDKNILNLSKRRKADGKEERTQKESSSVNLSKNSPYAVEREKEIENPEEIEIGKAEENTTVPNLVDNDENLQENRDRFDEIRSEKNSGNEEISASSSHQGKNLNDENTLMFESLEKELEIIEENSNVRANVESECEQGSSDDYRDKKQNFEKGSKNKDSSDEDTPLDVVLSRLVMKQAKVLSRKSNPIESKLNRIKSLSAHQKIKLQTFFDDRNISESERSGLSESSESSDDAPKVNLKRRYEEEDERDPKRRRTRAIPMDVCAPSTLQTNLQSAKIESDQIVKVVSQATDGLLRHFRRKEVLSVSEYLNTAQRVLEDKVGEDLKKRSERCERCLTYFKEGCSISDVYDTVLPEIDKLRRSLNSLEKSKGDKISRIERFGQKLREQVNKQAEMEMKNRFEQMSQKLRMCCNLLQNFE